LPWPLAKYNNKKSYCSIGNLCFIINELINREDIPSGIYNIADNDPISTNELIKLISLSLGKKNKYLNVPKIFIKAIAKIGNIFNLPFNSENIDKLTNSYVVSNSKLLNSIGTELPIKTKQGLILTFKTF
jgi:nucleoside-diphosphate-sugar epimerase